MKYEELLLPYLGNTDQLLITLQGYDYLVALESTNPNHENGRWSIISAQPKEVVSFKVHQDFQNAYDKILQLSDALPRPESNLPFAGGLIGHISYDLGIPSVQVKYKSSTQQELIICGLYTWAFVIDHVEKVSHLIYWHHDNQIQLNDLKAIFVSASNTKISANFQTNQPFKALWNKQTYRDKINAIHQYINSGDTYQVNLAQKFRTNFTGNPVIAHSRIKSLAKVPYATYFEGKDFSFSSASPEMFLSYENNTVTTKPIKGTLPRLPDPIKDHDQKAILASSSKDKAENLMIVDLLRNDLSKNASSIEVTNLFNVETFETVHHLVSTIKAKANSETILKLFFEAFPGGSITGAPKKRAMEIIQELEQSNRSFYCGSSFYFSANKKFNSNILIRSFLFEEGCVTCWAGGGIVSDSLWESEYQESLDKISRLFSSLY